MIPKAAWGRGALNSNEMNKYMRSMRYLSSDNGARLLNIVAQRAHRPLVATDVFWPTAAISMAEAYVPFGVLALCALQVSLLDDVWLVATRLLAHMKPVASIFEKNRYVLQKFRD